MTRREDPRKRKRRGRQEDAPYPTLAGSAMPHTGASAELPVFQRLATTAPLRPSEPRTQGRGVSRPDSQSARTSTILTTDENRQLAQAHAATVATRIVERTTKSLPRIGVPIKHGYEEREVRSQKNACHAPQFFDSVSECARFAAHMRFRRGNRGIRASHEGAKS